MGCVARTVSLSCFVVKGYRRTCTTNGQRTSCKPERRGWLATPHEQPRPMRLRRSAARQRVSRRWLRNKRLNRAFSKKHAREWGLTRMRYAASEKLEIIRLFEESHLSARRTLAKLGIPLTTFYRWYGRCLRRGEAGLQDRPLKPNHVWNRVPFEVKRKIVGLALKETELSPR